MLLNIARSCSYIRHRDIKYSLYSHLKHNLSSYSKESPFYVTENSKRMLSTKSKIDLEPFCYKQFDRKSSANYIPMEKSTFLNKLSEFVTAGDCKFADGYADFCKHIFVKNFTDSKLGILEITPENEHMLRSDYLRRTEKELPVLTRWFPLDRVRHLVKEAPYLDVILYSREQIEKEREIMGEAPSDSKADFYVVSIIPLSDMNERPMVPITIMRNALIEEGGSGVPIDRTEYERSVQFWSKHAIIIDM